MITQSKFGIESIRTYSKFHQSITVLYLQPDNINESSSAYIIMEDCKLTINGKKAIMSFIIDQLKTSMSPMVNIKIDSDNYNHIIEADFNFS
jgi:hypothetical protein